MKRLLLGISAIVLFAMAGWAQNSPHASSSHRHHHRHHHQKGHHHHHQGV